MSPNQNKIPNLNQLLIDAIEAGLASDELHATLVEALQIVPGDDLPAKLEKVLVTLRIKSEVNARKTAKATFETTAELVDQSRIGIAQSEGYYRVLVEMQDGSAARYLVAEKRNPIYRYLYSKKIRFEDESIDSLTVSDTTLFERIVKGRNSSDPLYWVDTELVFLQSDEVEEALATAEDHYEAEANGDTGDEDLEQEAMMTTRDEIIDEVMGIETV